jgi:hypothetical protein
MPPGGKQKIKMEPNAITLTNPAGSITIGLTPDDPTVTININSKAGIQLNSQAFIKLNAPLIAIEADGACTVSGKVVKIN